MSLDIRILAEERALSSSASRSLSPQKSSARSRRVMRAVSLDQAFSPLRDPRENETVRAARLAECDYRWNGSRSRVPSGEFVPPRWVPDEEGEACSGCGAAFDWLSRRHHCRHCGQLFCQACSASLALLPIEFGYRDPQRVCAPCLALLAPQQPHLSQTIANHMLLSHLDLSSGPCSLRRHLNLPYSSSLNEELCNASYSLHNLTLPATIRDSSFLLSLLPQAQGLVFLTLAKLGMFFTGIFGSGLVVSRLPAQKGGGWSPPCAVQVVGAGYGLSLGAELCDVVIVLNTAEALEKLVRNSSNFMLGGEVSLSLGGVGRAAGGALMIGGAGLVPPSVAFAHSRGLYAGLSLEGLVLSVRGEVNRKFYGRSLSPSSLLLPPHAIPPPRAAAALYTVLSEALSKGGAGAGGPRHCTESPSLLREDFWRVRRREEREAPEEERGGGSLSRSSLF